MEPRPEIRNYLADRCPGARVSPLLGDASTRRFYRIRLADGETRVLMDYGESFSGETDDLILGRVFRDAGLPVASVREVSGEAGCLLLEDLGDCTLDAALLAEDDEASRLGLLERAVLLAVDVAARGTPALEKSPRAAGPFLDAKRFRFEMDFFLEHYAGGLLGRDALPGALRTELHALADRAAETPRRVFCHRDFHSRNLMLRASGELAMVDLQDARWGPDSYDLASLLRDAYVDWEESWLGPLVETYRTRLPDPPAAEPFLERFHRVAAQRMIKALGTFGYQLAERDRDRYLDAIPRTLARLRRELPRVAETRPLFELFKESGLLEDPPQVD